MEHFRLGRMGSIPLALYGAIVNSPKHPHRTMVCTAVLVDGKPGWVATASRSEAHTMPLQRVLSYGSACTAANVRAAKCAQLWWCCAAKYVLGAPASESERQSYASWAAEQGVSFVCWSSRLEAMDCMFQAEKFALYLCPCQCHFAETGTS